MLLQPNIPLSASAVRKLTAWQNEVDAEPDFPSQVLKAAKQFKARNTRKNAVFREIRGTLKSMQGNLIRCVYCEDSLADEVEHIYPKAVFPQKAFHWINYVYACGPCNSPKNDQFSIFRASDGLEINVTPPPFSSRPAGWRPSPPPLGDSLLIDPRVENPLDFLGIIDLNSTCLIDPLPNLSTRDRRRAEYTCVTLGLNRSFLLRARLNAAIFAGDSLEKYSTLLGQGNLAEALLRKDAILNMCHRMVWKEMIRQRNDFPILLDLFQRHPEALTW